MYAHIEICKFSVFQIPVYDKNSYSIEKNHKYNVIQILTVFIVNLMEIFLSRCMQSWSKFKTYTS